VPDGAEWPCQKPCNCEAFAIRAQSKLASLTPKAISTIAGILTNKSGYIRLEAAKDILNRNGVGVQKDGASTQPLVISIKIGGREQGPASGPEAPEIVGGSQSTEVLDHQELVQPLTSDWEL
jgi:hypothetical protein